MQQEFQAVIMAAGKGSRMPEITAGKAKCLLPIGGKPMVWYPLLKLQQMGLQDAIMIVCESQKSEIQAMLDKMDVVIKIEYVAIPDNDEMGTADSLRFIQDKIRSDLIIMSCDFITDIDFGEVVHLFRKHDASVCTLLSNPTSCEGIIVPGPKTKHKPERDLIGVDAQTNRLVFLASASDFESDVSISRFLFKKHTNITMYSNLIDSHLYIMKNWVVKYLKHESTISTLKGEFLPHIIKKQLSKPVKQTETNMSMINEKEANDVFRFVQKDDLNEDILEASSYNDHFGDSKGTYHTDIIKCYAYLAKPCSFGIRVNTLPAYCLINAKIGENWEKITNNRPLTPVGKAIVKSNQVDNCHIWDLALLNEKTSFKSSIIGCNTIVNSYSRVFNSIVMNNVVIKEKVALENCIVCDGAVIEANSQLKGCLIGSNHTVPEGSQHVNEVLTDSDRLMEF